MSSAVHAQVLVSADGALPSISCNIQLLFIDLASVPGGQLVNSATDTKSLDVVRHAKKKSHSLTTFILNNH